MIARVVLVIGMLLVLSQVFTLHAIPAVFAGGLLLAFLAGVAICDEGISDGARDD